MDDDTLPRGQKQPDLFKLLGFENIGLTASCHHPLAAMIV
jgi:hypothetical protein